MLHPQHVGSEAGAERGTGGEVLDEHVSLGQDAMRQCGIRRVLDVGDQALLAAVEPDEIRRQPARRRVVAAGEVTLWPLNVTRAPASASLQEQ